MVGKSYRGQICVQNSSQTALKAHISAPLCTAGSLSFTPTCGFVQGLGELAFSVNFCPTAGTLERCSKYALADSLTIEVPICVTVPDQPYPLTVLVKAAITAPTLQFSSLEYDYGTCNVNEAIMCTVMIKNPTRLEQTFAFTGMPADVQVHSSTGVISPNSLAEVKVMLTPRAAGFRAFRIQVLSLCLSVATLSFTAVVTEPKLSLSHNLVQLRTTALCGTTTASILLRNHAASTQRFAFEKLDSKDLSITPAVGCISGGAALRLQIDYCPSGPQTSKYTGHLSTPHTPSEGPNSQLVASDIANSRISSATRPRVFPMSHSLACYYSICDQVSGKPACTSLEVRVCEVSPNAMLVGADVDPHSSRHICDFGLLPVGTSTQKTLMLKNMSNDDLDLKFMPTNPCGVFERVTACPRVQAKDSVVLRLQFSPRSGGIFKEFLQVEAGPLSLIFELHGAAAEPEWQINLLDVPADLGAIPETGSQALVQVRNPCQFALSCSQEIRPQCVCNVGNSPLFISHPSSMCAASGEFMAISMYYRPDWQVRSVSRCILSQS